MLEIVARVKQWLKPPRVEKAGPVPFAVPCDCKNVVEGQRQPFHQLVVCPQCGEKVFIFPQSPFPPVLVPPGQGASKLGLPLSLSGQWKTRIALGAGALVVAGVIVWAIAANQAPTSGVPDEHVPEMGNPFATVRTEMGQGKYHTALEQLDAARASRQYQDLPAAKKRELEQLRRQAALLADLQDTRLADIVRRAGDVPQSEWAKVFAHRYRGKAVLFDAGVRTNAAGKLRLDYRLFAAGHEARVEIDSLTLLKRMSFEQPARVIFGARLAAIGRDPTGAFVVGLDPDSGVLITERAALEACAPHLRDDPGLPDLLNRQQQIWARLP